MTEFQVTLKHERTVEEKIVQTVSTANPDDAIAVCKHLVGDESGEWKYSRTVGTSESSVEVKEVKSKKKE